MFELMNTKKFDIGLNNCEGMNFTFTLFENIEYLDSENPVSFYRCDFRRSKFENCKFYKNAFGRADFIDANISESNFRNVNFGSCLFKNSMISETTFKENEYRGISVQYSYYKNCTFEHEKIITNMFKTTFENCTFINCLFEKSSIEDVTFINCTFTETDISQCHAENLKFSACNLNEVYLGLHYWTTYLYKDTFINNFGFKYHGEVINITNRDFFQKSFDDLWNKDRLYEYFNLHIISKQISLNVDLLEITKKVLIRINGLPDIVRKKNILDMLAMIEFYYNYKNIDFMSYYKIINLLNEYNWEQYGFNESIEYLAYIYKLNKLCSNMDFALDYIYTIDTRSLCGCTMRLNFSSDQEAISYIEDMFDTINNEFCNNYFLKPYFEVESISKGSIVLDISSYALLIMLFSFIAKKVVHNIESIKIEHKLSTGLQNIISNENATLLDIKKASELALKYQLLHNKDTDTEKIGRLSSKMAKGEILGIILKIFNL